MKTVMKSYILLNIICFTFSTHLKAQSLQQIEINFKPIFNNKSLVLNNYHIVNADSFLISQCKFYISGIKLKNNNRTVFIERNCVYLINFSELTSCNFLLKIQKNIKFDEIQFNLGIDSLTNSKGISTGALDPTKGMYWAWHSGYINYKLEGQINKQKFQFHLGGFRNGFYNMQTIHLPVEASTKVNITVDLFKFLSLIDLQKTNHIMTPTKIAVELAQKAKQMFSVN